MLESLKKRRILLLALCCVLMLAESLILIHTRWVEDDNWYSVKGWTLATEGRIRIPVFPFDGEHVSNVITTLHALTLGGVFKLFGLGIVQARLTSGVFATLLVIVIYHLASDIAGPAYALVAALITATDSILLVAARTARPEAETAFFCWLAMLLIERALSRGSPRLGFYAGLSCGLGLICHPMAFPFFCAMALFCCAQYRKRVIASPVTGASLGGVAMVVVPYLAWCFSDVPHRAAFQAGYLDRIPLALHDRIMGELMRWSDFIGVSSLRVPLLPHVPLRLHIVVILAAAFWIFARKARPYGLAALALLLLNLGWLLFMVTKTPRYVAILAPLFAIVVAYLGVAAHGLWARRAAALAILLVLLTQIGGNLFWLYRYRAADYPKVASELQKIVPQGASVYGVITFWMALHDRVYYSYERTDFDRAITELRPQFLILYDRVMVHGSGYTDDWARLREDEASFVRTRATVAGTVSNEFYGDLVVYRVNY